MRANFERALAATLKHEGGWADHPADPGGATMKGITLATYRRYEPNATKTDLRNITDAEIKQIYRDGYWNKIKGDDLPYGVDFAVFDFAVNSGPARAAIYLQEIVGVAPDGKIGPLTLAAVAKWDGVKLVEKICANRLAFVKRLSTWPTFGRGWSIRISEVLHLAKDMAIALPQPQPSPTPSPSPTTPKRKTLMDWFRGWFVQKATNHIVSQIKDHPQMLNILPGLKTYIAGALMILVAVASLLGVDVPAVDPNNALQTIMEGFAIIFLRQGVKKIGA